MPKSPMGPIPGHKVGAVGMSWYREADYAAARAIMTDAHVLPATYPAWLAKAEQRESELLRDGHKVIRAIIDPATFPDWCRKAGLSNIDAKARTAFAAEYASRHIIH